MSFVSMRNTTYDLNHKMSADLTDNNNQGYLNGNEKKIEEVWSKHSFENATNVDKIEFKMGWANNNDVSTPVAKKAEAASIDKEAEPEPGTSTEDDNNVTVANTEVEKEDSPSHHARRPMNAFLIFCKKHRPIVRQKYPNLENRGVTRILGEWWALLESKEKQPYTDLAKDYKDAFLTANPNFKWYKLPAPPLRTLTTRPPTLLQQRTTPPQSSPPSTETTSPSTLTISEFTPGKLADESQLGGLTSLMNNCNTPKDKNENFENNNNNETISPVNLIKPQTPPKPIKKRLNDMFVDVNNVKRSLAEDMEQVANTEYITNQDFFSKVVDSCYTKQEEDEISNGLVRKSDRSCKGKRYVKFMYENKLLGNKKDTKLTQQKIKTDVELHETPTLDLNNTIKRLAERTNFKLDGESDSNGAEKAVKVAERVRTTSEMSDGSKSNNFNLDEKINNLPALSYDIFVYRKRESKKRKNRSRSESDSKSKFVKVDKEQLTGSKKRKNKSSITHLNKINNDFNGLTTLAEVAAITEKIEENLTESIMKC